MIDPVRAFSHQNEATAKSSANTATATAEYATDLGRARREPLRRVPARPRSSRHGGRALDVDAGPGRLGNRVAVLGEAL